jgi:DNA polymerase (family 10)
MAASNANVADFIRRYAAALVLQGADRFRVKAYRRAAETVESLDIDLADYLERGGDVTEFAGIGKAIGQMIEEIVRSGKLASLEKALTNLKPELVELATKPALDPKKVLRIYKSLKINSLDQLRAKLESGELREALGARLEFHVRRGLDDRPRMLLWQVEDLAEKIEAYLKKLPGVTHVSQTGSLRRKQDTVGDLNFLVGGENAAPIFKSFERFGGIQSSDERSKTERLFRLSSGLGISLQWTKGEHWGLALLLTTGSSTHVQQLEARATELDLELTAKSLGKRKIKTSQEADVYRGLRLSYIEPELREGRGEVELGASKKSLKLIEVDDLRGDLHMHTTASDGAHTLEEMASAARERGYQYIAITDHSQSLRITNGLTEERLFEQIRLIDQFNRRAKKLVVLKSAEVDILEDGTLDYSNAVLRELDFTICSIHSRFALDKDRQTARILRAMDNPFFNILGHATGRLLLSREGYEIDMEKILQHAQANGCYFEINSSPNRLDLSDEHARMAKELGIKIAINTDAHSIRELDFITAGVNQARRGWLEQADVLNALPLAKLRKALKRTQA